MTNVDKQAAKIREGLKQHWGARKMLAKRLGIAESTVRRHLLADSPTSNNIRLKTISVAAQLLLELKKENEKTMARIEAITNVN